MAKKADIIEPKRTDFLKFMTEVKSSRDDIGSKMDKRDQNFALMTELDGWQDFKTLAYDRIEKLKSMRDYEAAGRDLSELGLRFLVADIVAGELEDLIRRVDQAKTVYNEAKSKKDTTT